MPAPHPCSPSSALCALCDSLCVVVASSLARAMCQLTIGSAEALPMAQGEQAGRLSLCLNGSRDVADGYRATRRFRLHASSRKRRLAQRLFVATPLIRWSFTLNLSLRKQAPQQPRPRRVTMVCTLAIKPPRDREDRRISICVKTPTVAIARFSATLRLRRSQPTRLTSPSRIARMCIMSMIRSSTTLTATHRKRALVTSFIARGCMVLERRRRGVTRPRRRTRVLPSAWRVGLFLPHHASRQ